MKGFPQYVKWIAGLFLLALLLSAGQQAEQAFTQYQQAQAQAQVPAAAPACGQLAITFDDGPLRETTGALLDGLAQRQVHATFFLIGALAEQDPQLVLRMAEEGHQLGMHSYDHLGPLTNLNRRKFDLQVDRSRKLLEELLGPGEYMLRPPYGRVDANVCQWAGAPLILWSVDPADWGDRNVGREVESVVSTVRDGDIILMHDIFPESVTAALEIIDRLQAQGYSFCTVEELLREKGIQPEPGVCYYSAR